MGNLYTRNEEKNIEEESHGLTFQKQGYEFQSLVTDEHDVIFIVENTTCKGLRREFKAHANICANASPKFKMELEKIQVDSSNSDDVKYIYIRDVDPYLFDLVLNYCYGSESEIDTRFLFPLRKVAVAYCITDLINDIDKLLLNSLSVANFCEIYQKYGEMKDFRMLLSCLDKLKEKHENHEPIFSSTSFLKLRMDPDLRLLLQCRDLNVSEEVVWKRCLEWVRQEGKVNPKVVLRQIALYIELSMTDKTFLEHSVFPIIEELKHECDNDLDAPTTKAEKGKATTARFSIYPMPKELFFMSSAHCTRNTESSISSLSQNSPQDQDELERLSITDDDCEECRPSEVSSTSSKSSSFIDEIIHQQSVRVRRPDLCLTHIVQNDDITVDPQSNFGISTMTKHDVDDEIAIFPHGGLLSPSKFPVMTPSRKLFEEFDRTPARSFSEDEAYFGLQPVNNTRSLNMQSWPCVKQKSASI